MADKSILSVIDPIGDAVTSVGKNLGEFGSLKSWLNMQGPSDANAESLLMIIVALSAAFVLVLIARKKFSDVDKAVIPDEKFTIRTFFELFLDTIYGLMVGIMGEKNSRTFFPLIATCGVVIFFSNFLGLFPGMLPPTDNLNVTAAMAIVIFVMTHIVGLKTNGFAHIAHMANPIGETWGWLLAPLMFPIEVIGHIVRPVSLSLRLMGNMIGDHAVLAIFLGLVPLVIPIPFLVLGSIVCTVQTAVFCLLSMVYIGMACEEHHHEEGEAHH